MARDQGRTDWEVIADIYGISFWGDENVLELYGGVGCTCS